MPEQQDKDLQSFPEDEDDQPPVLVEGGDAGLPGFVQLRCLSNFSFQRGASHPHELVARAYNLGYEALAITDGCSMAGVVQALIGLREHFKEIEALERAQPHLRRRRPFRLLYGAELLLPCGTTLVALARDRAGWGNLCEFITAVRAPADKGEYLLDWATTPWQLLAGCELIALPPRDAMEIEAIQAALVRLVGLFGLSPLWLGVALQGELGDPLWLALMQEAGERCALPLVACPDVRMHKRSRKRLLDVVTAVREGKPVAECGFALTPNAQAYLHYRARLAQAYPPELLAATREVARRCSFRLEDVQYNYPRETVPAGRTPMGQLTRLTILGGRRRYPQGIPPAHRRQLCHELRLIADKRYEMFFLTVEDIVRWARGQGILCQGRGSSANSLVCHCLWITEVSPEKANMLFERFISRERDEAPDIDVDFEHQRREEVIQYIYGKYGRERAAIAAVVVRYRTRMALRDTGMALGIDARLVDAFAKDHFWFESEVGCDRLQGLARGLGVQEPAHRLALWLELADQLRGFPRHLSQHVGGFVLTQDKLTRLVPVEKASMPDRTVIQWDKDDLEAMNLLKVDVLALGMLSALRRCLHLCNQWHGRAGDAAWEMHHIPQEDPRVYDMICKADTVGVFQIESRAQMSMLPRLRPRNYYDLVVEVAIVRPGPIQGGMVHPYLKARERRRQGLPIAYIKDELAGPLGRTLGVPIFQEQVMQLAMVAAGFSADQADALRRSMAAWSRKGGVHRFKEPLVRGMVDNGYPQDFAEGIFKQIEGFGEYGFPESHAASFALLVYLSCWFKCHEPACFLAAMLNSQPMGFYSPSQLIQDARRHQVEVLPVDVALSEVDCTIEPAVAAPGDAASQPRVRLGLRLVGGLSDAGAGRIVAARGTAPFTDVEDLAVRAQLGVKDMNALAAADALSGLAGHRRQQAWAAAGTDVPAPLLQPARRAEPLAWLAAAEEAEDIAADYAANGFTLRRHPLALLRPDLAAQGWRAARELFPLPHGTPARACGIVNMRQRPPTAKGTMFVTLEDETGTVNVIVWKHVVETEREPLLKARLLAIEGEWQRDVESGGAVRHLIAQRAHDLTALLGGLARQATRSRDFH